MLGTLQFVKGAVAKKDFIPALSHFNIQAGRISGGNGRLQINAPIGMDINVKPRALPFIAAVGKCAEEVALALTPTGRLSIHSGTFRALIECSNEPYPAMERRGRYVELKDTPILAAFKKVYDFIGEDATRPWCMGALLRGNSVYATNNVVIVEYWLGNDFPVEVNVPKTAVTELLRIDEEPIAIQYDEASITFHYTGDRWLTSLLYATKWPDLARLLVTPADLPQPPDTALFEACRTIRPFVDDMNRVHFTTGIVSTNRSYDIGAQVHVPSLKDVACFNVDQFLLLEGHAQYLDLSAWRDGKPCLFFGERIRGAIAGMRAE